MSLLSHILDPGRHLLERTRLPGKFVLIGTVFVVSLGWLTFEMVRAQREIITFTEQESLGVEYLRSVRNVLEQAILATEVAALPDNGNAEENHGAADLAFKQLEAVDAKLAPELETTDTFKEVRERWQVAGSLGQGEKSAAAHRALLDSIQALNNKVGDTSNLILDPDMDSYYTVDIVLGKILQIEDLISQSRLIADRACRGHSLGDADRTQLVVVTGQVQGLLDGLRDDVRDTKAFSNPMVKERLGQQVKTFASQIDGLLAFLRDHVEGSPLNATPADLKGIESLPAQAGFQLYSDSSAVLMDLLKARIRFRTLVEVRDLGIACLGLLLCIYLFASFYQNMVVAFSNLAGLASAIKDGDLTARVESQSRDEVGQLIETFNGLGVALRKDIRQIAEISQRTASGATELAATAEQLSATTTEISAGAERQRVAMTQSSNNLRKVSISIEEVSERLEGANRLSSESLDLSKNGLATAHQCNQSMQAIQESSTKVAKINAVIAEIARQTNLLSLNAAIEAAKAGSQGRGFAVVAEEVRKLAERSAQAAKEITGLIQESADRVLAGVASVNGMSIGYESMEKNIRSQADGISIMAAAMKEDSQVSHELSQAVEFVANQAERNASATTELSATTSEIAKTTEELSSMANQLQVLAGRFTI
jgi:methyl-accepting chemotaxis protein